MMNKNEALKVQGFTALRKPQETTLDCLLAGPVSYTHLDVYKRQA